MLFRSEDIEKVVLDYFNYIYKFDRPVSFEASVGAVRQKVTPRMNEALMSEFKVEEVRFALNQMHPTKAPGPDGMSAMFFQKY